MSLRSSPKLSKAGWILILAVLLIGLALQPGWAVSLASTLWKLGPIREQGDKRLLISVENGRLLRLDTLSLDRTLRATTIGMQEARSPEAAELDVSSWEGQFLLVEGRDGGGWLYSARVVRALTPLESALARWAWPAAARSASP